MKGRINTTKDVEQELNIRLRAGSAKASEASVSWEFREARSLQRWAGHVHRRSAARRTSGGRSCFINSRLQRVIVKASYITHHPEKIAGVLRAHVKYLGRDSASLDGREGRFYDATREGIDARQRVQEWQSDARHFRFIVSPEQGHELNEKDGGLTAYTRELMQRVEKDLGTKLEWIAINHHNTDDLHTHLLVRGRRQDGKDLRIERQYIRHGMRQTAQEIATGWLGHRSPQQVKLAAEKELKADRYTALDAVIQRQANTSGRLQLKTCATSSDRQQRRRAAARLQYLESLGLAQRDRHGRWTVDGELKSKLQALSHRNDIIKNLYATLGPRSALVASYRGEHELLGTVAGRGTYDELRDRRYLLVKDSGQQLHYVLVANGEVLAALEEGSIVKVSGADPQRIRTDARIAQVARQNGGIYSADAHRNALPDHFATGDIDGFLRSHQRRLMTLERQGVAQRMQQGWRIHNVESLASGEQGRLRGGLSVVQIVSARSLQNQITAEAWTWLDRQMHRQSQGKTTSIPFDPAMEKSAEARRQWMIEHGYAAIEGARYVLRSGSAGSLRRSEWRQFQQKYQRQFGQPARQLLLESQTQVQYRGTVSLHAGLYAVVSNATEAVLAPVQRVPPLAYGTSVTVTTSTRGLAVLSPLKSPARASEQESTAERD